MRATWPASMWSALVSTLERPEWWGIALAGFLVRGGVLLLIVPIVSLPTPAAVANVLAPTIERIGLGGFTVERAAAAILVSVAMTTAICLMGVAGAWFDDALLRETSDDEDLALGWGPVLASARTGFALRFVAHVPTLLALAYATVRLIYATYDELLSPGAPAIPLASRVVARAPDAIVVALVAWLVGETVGGLAARRHAAGIPARDALRLSVRQLFRLRGLATLGLTTLGIALVAAPFAWGVGNAWEHLRTYLLERQPVVPVAAALLVLVASWILGVAVLGAALAWRSTAWTVEVAPPPVAAKETDGSPAPAPEALPG